MNNKDIDTTDKKEFSTRDYKIAAAIWLITGEQPEVSSFSGEIKEFTFGDDYSSLEKEYVAGELIGNIREYDNLRVRLLRKIHQDES